MFDLKNDNGFKVIDSSIIEKALNNIYSKKINIEKEIEKNLFQSTWQSLNEATDKAFVQAKLGDKNNDFIEQIKYNNAVFAAFKTHRQQNDIAKRLLDEHGNLKPYKQFKNDVENIIGKYNSQWLKTEYDTAIIRARQAANFKKYEQDKDLFPNLKWLPSTSPNPREAHVPLYGIVLPMDDPFWKNHYPGNVWNCKCSVTSTDEKPTNTLPKTQYAPAEGLEGNPAFTAKIFSDAHPYIKKQYPGAKKAVHNELPGKFDVAKKYNNGGQIEIHSKVNKKDSDYKDLYTISNVLAKKGNKVKILPKLHFKSEEYNIVFKDIIGTKYEKKCPDLKVNEQFFEYESYKRPFKKNKVSRMLAHGALQSTNIIIDNNKGASDRFLLKIISNRVKIGQEINQVWVFEKGSIRPVYKSKATN